MSRTSQSGLGPVSILSPRADCDPARQPAIALAFCKCTRQERSLFQNLELTEPISK